MPPGCSPPRSQTSQHHLHCCSRAAASGAQYLPGVAGHVFDCCDTITTQGEEMVGVNDFHDRYNKSELGYHVCHPDLRVELVSAGSAIYHLM